MSGFFWLFMVTYSSPPLKIPPLLLNLFPSRETIFHCRSGSLIKEEIMNWLLLKNISYQYSLSCMMISKGRNWWRLNNILFFLNLIIYIFHKRVKYENQPLK
jgi:hypothetical protein